MNQKVVIGLIVAAAIVVAVIIIAAIAAIPGDSSGESTTYSPALTIRGGKLVMGTNERLLA